MNFASNPTQCKTPELFVCVFFAFMFLICVICRMLLCYIYHADVLVVVLVVYKMQHCLNSSHVIILGKIHSML